MRAIGVSNFDPIDVDNLIKSGSIRPMVNQGLAHVSNTPFNVIEHSRENGALVEAYSPVAHGAILNHPTIAEMALRYGVIRVRLEMSASARDLALFNLAIDSKLPVSDLVRLKVEDVCFGRVVRDR